MKKAYLLTIILVTALATSAAAESLTLTTYYPAPFGAYDRMRFVPRPAIGGTSCDLGTIFYNSDDDKLTMCAAFDADGEWVPITGPKGGIWQQEDLAGETNVYLTDWQNMDLRVGIGTDDPTAMFEILDTGQTLSGERGHFSIFGDANIDSDVADMNFDGGPDANFTIVHNGADGSNSRTRFMWVDPNTGTWHNRMDIWNSGRVAINSDGSPWGNFQVDGDTAQFGVNAGWANAQPWPTSSDPWPYIWFNGFNNSGACTGWTCTPGFNFRFFRGTSSARTTAQSDDWLGYINFGSGDTANGDYTSASIGGIAGENQVFGTNQGGQLVFNTTANGSTSLLERMRITHDGKVGVGGVTPQELLYSYLSDANGGYSSDQTTQQAIKGISWRTSGNNYGVNGTAAGVGATTNKGLYGWATGATFRNWGLHVDTGYGRFDDDVIIGAGDNTAPSATLHVQNSGTEDILNLYDDTTEALTVTDGGRMGIHMTNPESYLNVHEPTMNVNFATFPSINPSIATFAMYDAIMTLIGYEESVASSIIQFIKVATNGNYQDKWAMGRNGDARGNEFYLSYVSGSTVNFWSSSAARRITVLPNGNVGIGSDTTPDFLLEVTGTAGKPGGGSWSSNSDRRLKKNIQPLSQALQRMLALQGVTFEWKEKMEIEDLNGPQLGMIAQDVETVFPQWVEDDASGYKILSFRGFEALTVESFREMKAMLDLQKETIKDLQAENERLNERLERVERLLNSAP